MLANPESPPKINWEQYKKVVPVPGLVDKFQSEYSAFKVPYPEDKLTATIDKQWTDLQVEIAKFSETNKAVIAKWVPNFNACNYFYF